LRLNFSAICRTFLRSSLSIGLSFTSSTRSGDRYVDDQMTMQIRKNI
jgi:hypothetical protein